MLSKSRIAEGKTKIVLPGPNSDALVLEFKNDITAFDGEKHDLLPNKGTINAMVSAKLFEEMEKLEIPTHFVRMLDETHMVVRKLTMFPMEVVCRNIAAGHLIKSFPMFKKGEKLPVPIIQFFLKDDALHDPLLVDDIIVALNIASRDEISKMRELTLRINGFLKTFMIARDLQMVDFKLEFGRDSAGEIRLADELSIDSMRLWDTRTGAIIDKDVYRQGATLEAVAGVYQESLRRITGGSL